MSYAGLLLAGGMGKRMGLPKALIRLVNGQSLVVNAMRILKEGGCGDVIVVVGAGEEAVRRALDAAAEQVKQIMGEGRLYIVSNPDFEEGMASSVRVGMRSLPHLPDDPDAVIVQLVDTPDVSPDAVARVGKKAAPEALALATYDGTPGHPILLGRDHWSAIAEVVTGDEGARKYLRGRDDVQQVPCDGLGSPADLDTPEQLAERELAIRVPADVVRAEVVNDEVSVAYLEILCRDRRAGAVVSFSGTVRDHDEGRAVTALKYLSHPNADETIKQIAHELSVVPGVRSLAVQHRVGELAIGDVALGCCVAAEHRQQAFEVCSQIVERVKIELPIWKQQVFDDGTDEWVNAP